VEVEKTGTAPTQTAEANPEESNGSDLPLQ